MPLAAATSPAPPPLPKPTPVMDLVFIHRLRALQEGGEGQVGQLQPHL
ncbi:unnamed protein product [Camellia sinensis]